MTSKLDILPKAFIWRRLHSLTGLWLVLFLIEHLITNSQAALWVGDGGKGFVRLVDLIGNLPYLKAIEVLFLGVPILIHGIWGVRYALTAKANSMHSDGSKPYLKYSRNKAYTWQRITSWILVVLLAMHIVKFRFLDYPTIINRASTPTFLVKVSMDPGLYTVTSRLNMQIYDAKAIDQLRKGAGNRSEGALIQAAKEIRARGDGRYNPQDALILDSAQSYEEKQKVINALTSFHLKRGEVVATGPTFGTASLLSVRNTFKSPMWVGIYTIFVLSACFHAFNGLWTSMLTWGWVVREATQTKARLGAFLLMLLITILGLCAVWGTYFWNLKY